MESVKLDKFLSLDTYNYGNGCGTGFGNGGGYGYGSGNGRGGCIKRIGKATGYFSDEAVRKAVNL